MEEWEAIVSRPIEPGYRTFEKIVQTAGVILKNHLGDLAPFETEWIINTLLYKPVDLLRTVSENRGDELWFKPLCDALKLLAELVEKCDCVEKYYEDIVNLCLLNYEPESRKHALSCLARLARRSDVGARSASRHVAALQEASQCKTPLALLVGTICEHHPYAICNDVTTIWRTYLNMLESNKNTDTVTKAILEGIRGLFKHFGQDLPTAELNNFYENLSNKYMKLGSCQTACLDILESHASLFKERISLDKPIREALWTRVSSGGEAAILNVYKVVYNHVEKKVFEKIVSSEVLPHTQSTQTKVKLTALRILVATKSRSPVELSQFVDLQRLESEFRGDRVTRGDAEVIAWCIESHLPNSERLLQAAILFYDKLPANFRKKIVVDGILESPHEARQAAIHFLITQSITNPALVQIWRDLYDASNADALVEKSRVVTREFSTYLTNALEMFLDDEFEDLPPKLTSLLDLTSKVAPLHNTPLPTCASLLCELSESHLNAKLIAALRTLLKNVESASGEKFYKSLRIEGCRDEATLHESCLSLVQAPNTVEIGQDDMMLALQIIFSSDVEPTILIDALKKFDHLLSDGRILDQQSLNETMKLVEKLRARGDKTDKHIRILHREVLMFLGKHRNVDMNNNTNESECTAAMNLKKSLALNLPDQGTTYKINLQRILLLALQHENPEVLQKLLIVICANLSSNKEQSSQLALTKIIQTLSKIHANGSTPYTEIIRNAIEMCRETECVRDIIQYVSSSKSCGVRKLLATAVSTLCEDPEILQLTVERATVMLTSSNSTMKRAGLDISETIIASLEHNNSLCKTLLPELTVLIAKTKENDTKAVLESAFKMIVDKRGLFEMDAMRILIKKLLENLIKTDLYDVKVYKICVKITLNFVKNLQGVKLDELTDVLFDLCQSGVYVEGLYVFAVLKKEFDFDTAVARKIIGRNNMVLIEAMLKYDLDDKMDLFVLEAILKFIEEYCHILLELKYTETIQFTANIITNLTPNSIRKLRHNIKQCFSSLQKHWKETPTLIRHAFQYWTEKLPLNQITDGLEKEHLPSEHVSSVNSLKIMSNVFDIKDLILSNVKTVISKWPELLLKLFASGRLEEYFFNEMSYFNDVLTVSLEFLSKGDFKKILKEGRGLNVPTKDIGMSFCGYFVRGFFDVLTEKPLILLEEDAKCCALVLNDLVKCAVKRNCSEKSCENILELVDKLWSTYELSSTFAQKHLLLVNLECLAQELRPDSNPLRFVIDTVCCRDASIEDRLKMLGFVPEDSLSSPQVTSAVTSLFPARFCELHPTLLEVVSRRPYKLYIEILATLAENDPSKGWWCEALDACLSAAAQNAKCVRLNPPGARAARTVLAPLLRYSSWQVCEEYLSTQLRSILTNISKRPVGVRANHNYKKSIEDYMTNLRMLLVAFEKLPTASLESPSSRLYGELRPRAPWHAVRETCRLCVTLRDSSDVACPSDATEELKETYRQFQCLLYNCVCAAICRRRPGERVYTTCFELTKWRGIQDESEIELPVRAGWLKRNKSLPVAVPVEASASTHLPSRSRMFLRTLSEHPMMFDLHSQQEEVLETQDVSLPETSLNAHPCAATMTALFRHAVTLPFADKLWAGVVEALESGDVNLKWLVAQVICNCRDELKPHASALLPGLLAVVANTVQLRGKNCLNGLHIDVLDTIILWNEPAPSQHLSTIAYHLITTCMEHRGSYLLDGLMRTLYGFLELYGSQISIEWECFEPYYEDESPSTNTALSKLIQLISKAKLHIPQVQDKILSKFDRNPPKMAECFGLAMAACPANERGEPLARFRKLLEKSSVTNYVKMLYYASLGCAECCGEFEFRKITDYVTKVSSHERTKCLHIISIYLEHASRSQYVSDMFDTADLSELVTKDHTAMLVIKTGMHLMPEELKRRLVLQACGYCHHSTGKVRLAALGVMLKAFEGLFTEPSQPPSKRQRTESTLILSTHRDDAYARSVLTSLGCGAADASDEIARIVRQGVADKLDRDLGVRFAECFLLVIYLPSLHSKRALDLCACAAAILEMLFSHLRSADSFKHLKLREEPLVLREAASSSKLLTLSKAFQGTFSSYSSSRVRKNKTSELKSDIDVQVPIDSILETLLEFAKTTPSVSCTFVTEALHCILQTRSSLAPTLSPLLGAALGREPADVTPLCLRVCRMLLQQGNVTGMSLREPALHLKNVTRGTEGASLASLLYEEVLLHSADDDIYRLGTIDFNEDTPMYETRPFSIEDLKSAFGRLSNWDNLTIRQQNDVKKSVLPPLWTGERDFINYLDSYEVPEGSRCWFDKMALCLRHEVGANGMNWLRSVDKWPRKHFEISAVTEALSWRHDATEAMPCESIFTTDCLAEWAARLMIRSCYHNSLQHSQTDKDRVSKLSRSSELRWCVRANEMGVSGFVLDCVKRNVDDLCETEALPWLRQKLLALRQIGLETNDYKRLEDILEIAKTQTPKLCKDPAMALEMYHLMLQLHGDTKSLTYHELQSILMQVTKTTQEVDWSRSPKTAVSSICEIAMSFYDESWDTGALDKDSVLSNMSHVLCQAADWGARRRDVLLAALLNRIHDHDGSIDGKTAEKLLEKLSLLTPTLDSFSLDLLKMNLSKFPPHLKRTYSLKLQREDAVEKYGKCLQLVCDSGHLLMMYCEDLLTALEKKDADLWKTTFDRMRRKIYENPYAGPSYRLLDKYKEGLYRIHEFDSSSDFASKAEKTLSSIRMALYKEPQPHLRISDLCPALLDNRGGESECPLLGGVVKFYDKVQVFTDSIRRPVIISMLMSNGKVKRLIHKSGESLTGDAAAQRVASCAGAPGYGVTLLDEDSALIEYLEGHERLRTLIESSYDINVLSVRRPADKDLIVTPMSACLQTHRELSSKLPAYALRSVLEQNSCSVQDFIQKKQKFTDSLAHITVLTWILGLGDRHLQNIMCARDGRLQCVDYGAIWRHGTTELPARLTRNLVAVCDVHVLESRLQAMLTSLRDSHRLFEAVIRLCFRWTADRFHEKFTYIQDILRGKTLSYHVARHALSVSTDLRHKDRHVQLLDQVFHTIRGHSERDIYSVQDQVSCLLYHCTSPELLSVTRAGWEPWL